MAAAEWIFLEGYRYDGPDSIAAFEKAVRAAKRAGGKVGDHPLRSLLRRAPPRRVPADDPRRRRPPRRQRARAASRSTSPPTSTTAMARAEAEVPLTACTVGAKGAHILGGGERVHAPATKVTVVDATGAGDLFAAGFLHGLTTGRDRLTARAHGLPRRRRGDLATSAPGPRPTCAALFAEAGPRSERRRARSGRRSRAAPPRARQPAPRHRADDPDLVHLRLPGRDVALPRHALQRHHRGDDPLLVLRALRADAGRRRRRAAFAGSPAPTGSGCRSPAASCSSSRSA